MKNIILTSLIGLVLVACPGQKNNNQDASVADVVDPVPTEVVVEGQTWEITLPQSWKQDSPISASVELWAENISIDSLLVLTKESYAGTFDQFSLEAIRGFRGQGAEIGSMQSVSINGYNFTKLESTQGDVDLVTLLTVKNGFGYSLDCGGDESFTFKLKPECQQILSSFKLK